MENGNGWILMPLYLFNMVLAIFIIDMFVIAIVFLVKWLRGRKKADDQRDPKKQRTFLIVMIVAFYLCAGGVISFLWIHFDLIAKYKS